MGADAPAVNLALNKVQPAAILQIPAHFESCVREEAAKPSLKFTGERVTTCRPAAAGGTGPGAPLPSCSNLADSAEPSAALAVPAELKQNRQGIPLLLRASFFCKKPKQQKAINRPVDTRVKHSEARTFTSSSRIYNLNTAPL